MRVSGNASTTLPMRAAKSSTRSERSSLRRVMSFPHTLTFAVCILQFALLRLKHLALHHLMHESSESIILLAVLPNNRLDLGFVRRLRRGAGGIGQQLLGQSTGELILVLEKQLFELVNVLEPRPVGRHARRIDLRTHMIRHPPTIHDNIFPVPVSGGSILLAPAADHVEAFESEAWRLSLIH